MVFGAIIGNISFELVSNDIHAHPEPIIFAQPQRIDTSHQFNISTFFTPFPKFATISKIKPEQLIATLGEKYQSTVTGEISKYFDFCIKPKIAVYGFIQQRKVHRGIGIGLLECDHRRFQIVIFDAVTCDTPIIASNPEIRQRRLFSALGKRNLQCTITCLNHSAE